MHISKQDARVAAAADAPVNAGGEQTLFRSLIESGLISRGVPTAQARTEALGCIRTALEQALKERHPLRKLGTRLAACSVGWASLFAFIIAAALLLQYAGPYIFPS
jgi:hypothetical protein